MACHVLFRGVQDEGRDNKQMKYGVAGRRRRCRSAARVSLVTAGRNAEGGTAAAVSRY